MVIAVVVFVSTRTTLHFETATARITIDSATDSVLNTSIDFGSGTLVVQPGSPDTLVSTLIVYPEGGYEPDVSLDSNVLRLGLRRVFRTHFGIVENVERSAHVALSPSYTYSMEIDLGTGDSYLDLSRLPITDLSVNSGVGDVVILCDTIQPVTANQVYLDLGTGDVIVYGLGNLRMEKVTANMGVGDVEFDLAGGSASDISVFIDMGVGDATFYVPVGVGVRLTVDTGIGEIVADGAFVRSGNVIASPTYETDTLRYDITVDTGVGDISLKTGRPEPPSPPELPEPSEPPAKSHTL
jgi:hypothetical protein